MKKSEESKILKRIKENLIKESVKIQECNEPKDIGDRVMVWRSDYNGDIEAGEHYSNKNEIFEWPGIIIEKDCKNHI